MKRNAKKSNKKRKSKETKKMKKKNFQKQKSKKEEKEKEPLQGVPPETAQIIDFLKEMLQEIVHQLRSKKKEINNNPKIKKEKKN